MQTAAGQLSVAVENARLFAEELRRSKQLSFLNSISKMAISSEDAEQMLADIVAEIQKTFQFDHIGIGILDYVTKEIEIRAEAGATAHSRGKRIPLGTGIVGRVARSNERALVQNAGDGHLVGVLPDSRAVLCIPITYGESLLGVLNVESRQENAFSSQDVLIMTPYSITRFYNGEMSNQRFLNNVTYNDPLNDSLFDAKTTYDPNTLPPRKK